MRAHLRTLARAGAPLTLLIALGASWAGSARGADEPLDAAASTAAAVLQPRSFAQQAKLVPSERQPEQRFGASIAISGDTLVVGAPGDLEQGEKAGAVYVFTRAGSAWIQQAKLMASDGQPFSCFGSSVAIAGDTIAVGAMKDHYLDPGPYSGSAYVFTRRGGRWTQQAKLLPSGGTELDRFGTSVAIMGGMVLVGAPEDRGGAVYVFGPSGGGWTQRAKLRPRDAQGGDEHGVAVAASGDTLVVGASGVGGDTQVGAAYVYTRDGTFRQQARLSGDPEQHYFGGSGAISGDTIVVGVVDRFRYGSGADSVFVFARRGGRWSRQAELASPGPARGASFGWGVALSGDTLIVGAPNDLAGRTSAAYVYARTAGRWTLQALLVGTAPADSASRFGRAVAVSGGTVVVGDPYEASEEYEGSGAAYVFVPRP